MDQNFATQWVRAIQHTALNHFLANLTFEVQITQCFHLLGIALIIGSSVMILLRLLGRLHTEQDLGAVAARFLPSLWTGLALAACTGVIMVLTEPGRSLPTYQFQSKMVLLVIGVLLTLRLRRATLGRHAAQPSRAVTALALALLVVWVAMIIAGRWIAYV
jgi:hypothetical protein